MKIFAAFFLVFAFIFTVSANSFDNLNKLAADKTKAKPRVELADEESVKEIKNADALESGNVPNYIKALAKHTKAAPQHAKLVQTFLFGGTVAPETKMAMGLKIAHIYNSPYIFAHSQRWLNATPKGRELLKNLSENKTDALSNADKCAVIYAELLTKDIHGVSDAEFEKLRGVYNDSQIVELTMVVSFFNHFTRMVEALNLPVETWVLEDKNPKIAESVNKTIFPTARIALISDDEMSATTNVVNASKEPQKPAQGLGLGVANSQRAMLRVPALAMAWREFGFQNRQNWLIDRNIQLQVSFAVSNANGCRYCTVHQVVGLKRLGVDPKKLVSMKKEDSQLTPRELTAVEFARKLTKEPVSVTDSNFEKLKKEFTEQGAVEVVLQTGAFAFMNRFTDGLRLPSEDEAIKIYQETYGDGTYKTNYDLEK